MAFHPCRRTRAVISRASAPQAITRVRGGTVAANPFSTPANIGGACCRRADIISLAVSTATAASRQ